MKTLLITLVAMLGLGATIAGPLGPGARENMLDAFDPAGAALPAMLPGLAPGTVEAVSPAARAGGLSSPGPSERDRACRGPRSGCCWPSPGPPASSACWLPATGPGAS